MSDFTDKAKKVVLWVLLPLTAVIGAVVYILSTISSLKQQLARAESEKDLAKVLGQKEEATKEADKLEHNYDDLLKKYRDGG